MSQKEIESKKAELTKGTKTVRLVFSRCEEDFLYFADQFEARMQPIKLGKVLGEDATYLDYMQAVKVILWSNAGKLSRN